jgi:glycosyltransferase involved in cell wall biosynthesis
MGRLADLGIKTKKIAVGMDASSIYDCFDSDVFVFARPHDKQTLQMMQTLKREGKKIVTDYDDNLWEVSPFSEHYADFGTEDVRVQVADGTWMDVWQDGRNFDITKNKETLLMAEEAVKMSDMVTVTQPKLAEAYAEHNPNVVCLPNCIDLELWRKLPMKRRDDVRLYWSGGSSHYQDWLILHDVLPIIFNRYKQVKLVIMGTVFKGTIKSLDKRRIECNSWVHTQAYPYKSAIMDADISIIPLEENKFNVGKSNIKWVEQSALEVPSVCSAITPYVDANNGVNGVFVKNTVDDWVDGISALVEDSILRAKLAAEARKTVEMHYSIDSQKFKWVQAYESLLK